MDDDEVIAVDQACIRSPRPKFVIEDKTTFSVDENLVKISELLAIKKESEWQRDYLKNHHLLDNILFKSRFSR